MRAASIAFPFRKTFQRLELQKRWWHRLSIVIFFALLLGTTVFTVWVSYSIFAPQVETMPGIASIADRTETEISSEADVDVLFTQNDGPMTLKQFGQKIKAQYPVYTSLDDEAIALSVLNKYPQHRGEIKYAAGEPSKEAQNEAAQWDLTTFIPLVKTIEMPDGSTSRFVATVSSQRTRHLCREHSASCLWN